MVRGRPEKRVRGTGSFKGQMVRGTTEKKVQDSLGTVERRRQQQWFKKTKLGHNLLPLKYRGNSGTA
jgi:hypothetical protein